MAASGYAPCPSCCDDRMSSQRGGHMGGTTFGIGSPFTYPSSQLNPFTQMSQPQFGQQYGQQYGHPLQQVLQILRIVPQQLQQLQHLEYLQQQQLQQVQQI